MEQSAYPAHYKVELNLDTVDVGDNLQVFYNELRNVVATPPAQVGDPWILKIGEKDIRQNNALFFVRLLKGEQDITFPYCTKSLYARGHQKGKGPVTLLRMDKSKQYRSKKITEKELLTKNCLEKEYGQTIVQSENGDSYLYLQRDSGCLIKDLRFGYVTLRLMFDDLINAANTDDRTISRCMEYMAIFVSEALPVQLIEDSIIRNFKANEGLGMTIPENILLYVQGWGRASLCVALGDDNSFALSVNGKGTLTLLEMKTQFGVLMKIVRKQKYSLQSSTTTTTTSKSATTINMLQQYLMSITFTRQR